MTEIGVDKQVLALIARETGLAPQRISLNALIERDLGCTGGDAWDLLVTLAEEFKIDMSGFDFASHFDDESMPAGGLLATIVGAIAIASALMAIPRWIAKALLPDWVVFIVIGMGMFAGGWLWSRYWPSERRRQANKIPVRVQDLIEAARVQRWPYSMPAVT